MPRDRADTLLAHWKLSMPAPLTAQVDLLLLNPLTNKPQYGERSRITKQLWESYLSVINATEKSGQRIIPLPDIPGTLFEIAGHRFTFSELCALVAQLKPKEGNAP